MFASRILEVDKGSFTLLVFTTIRGKADECKRYHSRLAEVLSIKRGENHSTTVSWIRAKVSFAPPEIFAAMLDRVALITSLRLIRN